MSTGAAYLPIDENCPAERLSFILADSDAHLLITTSRLSSSLQRSTPIPIIEIDRIRERESNGEPASIRNELDPHSLAYLIYTSGSTGQPKGVEITHEGLSHLIAWHNRTFEITHEDRASQIAGLSFDAAVWEIWPYLASGATLCIPQSNIRQDPVGLQQWLVDENITVAFVPTVLTERLIEMEWPSKTKLRLLLTGGDALRKQPRKGLPFAVVNNYGPTECTVVATSGYVSPQDGNAFCGVPSIGGPITHTEVHIVTADLREVTRGQAGELCIGGPSLARGYRNRPELTAERFIPNPFHAAPHARLYRTGDLVRMSEDGQIHFLGRLDDQVKIRGYRIEPNEVTLALHRHPAVSQCVVVGRGEGEEKQLVAYIVPSRTGPVSYAEIREFLGKTLPDYMLPSAFVTLNELPLNENGKIDYAALPTPRRGDTPALESPESPSTNTERQIAAMVRNLLAVEEIGIKDNFFLFGGHSLFGAQLIARLAKRFKVEVPLRTIFESPTVASLAAQVERLRSEQIHPQGETQGQR